MANLEALRSHLSQINHLQVQADGYALWMMWHGEANPVVLQTLEDYGGLNIAEESGQALWFFFSTDALLAAARLGVWSRFNPLPFGLQIFPARFQAGQQGDKNLILDDSIWRQELKTPSEFQIYVHSSMAKTVEMSPGLSLQPLGAGSGLDISLWSQLEVDPRLPYQSPQSWYVLLRPVGNPVEKSFQLGWRDFFGQLEALLQRNKFRFTVQSNFVMFPLDSLRQFRIWCHDFLSLIQRLKEENPEHYWPTVMAVVDRKGLSMNEDLPQKIGLDWEHLIPDYPHMSVRNALMLGEEFAAHDVRFAPARHQPDDWVSLSLRDEGSKGGGALPQLAPIGLILGSYPPCFYCGQRSHEAAKCPSRFIDPIESSAWPKIAQMDFSAMRDGVRAIDALLDKAEDEEARLAAISAGMKEETSAGLMLKAFYDTIWPVQLRAVGFFWRARDKDLQKAAKKLAPLDNNPAWDLLGSFNLKSRQEIDEEIQRLSLKQSKDFRLLCLRGFYAMEGGDLEKAEKFWKDAEMNSPHPIVQSWHTFLQARALECLGQFSKAAGMYDQVSRLCPSWLDAEYRRAVCLVKSGFSEQALSSITGLISKSGHFFNKALVDPELERGYIQVMATLYGLWVGMEARAKEEEGNLHRMRDELGTWFLPENPFAGEISERIMKVLQTASVKNYVAFQMLVTGRAQIERDIQAHVLDEARSYKNLFRSFNARLKVVHEESAWFPFPKTLVEFNRSYNESVENANWALTANLHSPESFRKAQLLVEKEGARLKKLEGRLKLLKVVRDGTLFILSMIETFLWLEITGIILIFAVLPLFLVYGDKLGMELLVDAISRDRWQV